jgi:hypothetical protein
MEAASAHLFLDSDRFPTPKPRMELPYLFVCVDVSLAHPGAWPLDKILVLVFISNSFNLPFLLAAYHCNTIDAVVLAIFS